MKRTKSLIKTVLVPGLAIAALLSGCGTTGGKAPAPQPQTAAPASVPTVQRQSGDGYVVYEDHLVKVVKRYGSGSTVGQTYTYDIDVTAKQAVTNVEIDEFLPSSVKFKDSDPKAAMNQFGMPSWDLEAIKAGETKNIKVMVIPSTTGTFDVCSVIRADPLVCLPLFVGEPKLSITKTGPAMVELGESATWNIAVKNVGNAAADMTTITDTMPKEFTPAGALSKNAGTLMPGDTATFQVAGKSTKVGKFVNEATANFDGGTPVSATAPIEVVNSAVSITKTGPAEQYIFVPADYKITITNKGSTTLTNLVVTDNIPDGAVLHGKVEKGGEVYDVKSSGQTIFLQPMHDPRRNIYGYWLPGHPNPQVDDTADQVVWKLPSLAAGESHTWTLTYTSAKPGTLTNVATVSTDRGLSESASAKTLWKAVPGVHTTLADSIDPIQIGQQTVYTIRALNQSPYEGITITSQVLTFPANLKINSVSAGGTVSGQVVTFGAVDLAPGKEVTRTVTATGVSGGTVTIPMETMTNFRTVPIVDQESTTIY
ncbi:DUF7507 domain-containing protein [Cerasicoccus arenae]|uniref:DUF11 domain-containing protein n=1 Tax=Cerasicoccus arenae TaxID=424488 RepID=A0A8J3D9D5_9BACT|nr:DUF11 domain-containing protein [Cerasicoccus arenae]MBK1857749.1 hypothetical protein [Cerasicoccus arenae]GHB91028.1 hypothetical protein GCM10007047_02410 [Cerasicoccus arenae]